MNGDKIPFSRPFLGDEEIEEVVAVLRSGWLTSGPRVQRFEREFASYVGSEHAAAVSSCTAALHLALLAHGIGPGDEVVTSPITWPATANCVELVGARPVFADVDPGTLQLTPASAGAAITLRTRAILPVHFAGQACDLDGFAALAQQHGLAVIEDAAHAAGTEYRGRRIGAGPNTACFSFHPAKNLTTAEGGMVTTPDAAVAERVRRLRFHGIDRDAAARHAGRAPVRYETVVPGFKYNLTDLQAAIGIHQLARLDGSIEQRAKLAALYRDALRGCAEATPLALDTATTRHSWHLFVVRLDLDRLRCAREEFAARLDARGIATGLHFTAVHLHRYYRERYGYAAGDLPESERADASVLSLPLFPGMDEADVARVCGAIRDVAREAAR
ncbi:MAG TPA: aminotransferase class I/II-fold pyridoxal phosphate-dependent enzyme [Myxococcota bacterium]|nr:aminotransferase class I/II-fold pyridoxal phosphate-dependent enzyme [Myxococcota bacterium]